MSAPASEPTPVPTVADVVVIGGGAAGLSGALMLARSRRSVVVIDSGSPRNAPAAAVHGLLARDGTPPAELLRQARREVADYGGLLVSGAVATAAPATTDGDPRFHLVLTDGTEVVARRLLVATGVRDLLPNVPGLAEHWGSTVVHCPYCHGWEVRDLPIGILAVSPASAHQALLFRQLSDDVIYFVDRTELAADVRERFAARGVRVVDGPVAAIRSSGGRLSAVELESGQAVDRAVLAVATRTVALVDGLDGLALPMEDLPGGMGRRIVSGMSGTTAVPGVWVAGNATEPHAQVGAAAAAGALAGAHINADLVAADTEAAMAARSGAS